MGLKSLLVRYSPNLLYSWLFSSPRRPGPDGEGGVEAWDGMTPLHLACEGGLDNVLQTLVEHKVNVNSKVCHRLKKEKKRNDSAMRLPVRAIRAVSGVEILHFVVVIFLNSNIQRNI